MQQRIATHTGRAGHLVFARLHDEGRQQTWLARQTGFSHAYVRAVKSGVQAPTARFRAACAALFDLPESVLFHGDASSASQPEGESDVGSDGRAGTAVPRAYAPEEDLPIGIPA